MVNSEDGDLTRETVEGFKLVQCQAIWNSANFTCFKLVGNGDPGSATEVMGMGGGEKVGVGGGLRIGITSKISGEELSPTATTRLILWTANKQDLRN